MKNSLEKFAGFSTQGKLARHLTGILEFDESFSCVEVLFCFEFKIV